MFDGVVFNGASRFDGTKFKEGVFVGQARFKEKATFRGSELAARTDLAAAVFADRLDCTEAQVKLPFDPAFPEPDSAPPPAGTWPVVRFPLLVDRLGPRA